MVLTVALDAPPGARLSFLRLEDDLPRAVKVSCDPPDWAAAGHDHVRVSVPLAGPACMWRLDLVHADFRLVASWLGEAVVPSSCPFEAEGRLDACTSFPTHTLFRVAVTNTGSAAWKPGTKLCVASHEAVVPELPPLSTCTVAVEVSVQKWTRGADPLQPCCLQAADGQSVLLLRLSCPSRAE